MSIFAKDRLAALTEANVLAVHAYQILLVRKSGKAFPAFESDLNDAALQEIVAHQQALLAWPDLAAKWAKGKDAPAVASRVDSILSAGLKLDAALPVNVFTRALAAITKKRPAAVRSVANMYQMVMEIDRDGTTLQELYDLYIALGLPVYIGQLGLSNLDQDLEPMHSRLVPEFAVIPFVTTPRDMMLATKKLQSWAEKKLHIRDDQVLAEELLQEPDVQALVPAIKAMRPRRIAVVGHSFTMHLNWSTPSSFTCISAALLKQVNPDIQVEHFCRGGMQARYARDNFLKPAMEWKPDVVFFFFLADEKPDLDAVLDIDRTLRDAGIAHFFFPHNGPMPYNNVARFRQFTRENNLPLADFVDAVDRGPDKDKYVSLDTIHMTEPYHRIMAKELLKLLTTL